ncbi:MAG: hypothetical protein IKR13_01775, partial [Victivallales bacterium]|nr:hypothetical protein [Victivallales bacterium]
MKLERPKQSTFKIFWRLMRGYALRYPGYLAVGLLSAILMGGSLGMAFRMMSTSVDLFEAGTAPQTTNASHATLTLDSGNDIKDVPQFFDQKGGDDIGNLSSEQLREERNKDKSTKLLDKVNRILAIFHVDPVDNASVLDIKTVAILLGAIVFSC